MLSCLKHKMCLQCQRTVTPGLQTAIKWAHFASTIYDSADEFYI